jgi:drug/metabolite transporter (DMT)-like permease
MMPFAIVFGFLLFADVPSWSTLGGAAVVAAAGSYNAYRERVRRVQPA